MLVTPVYLAFMNMNTEWILWIWNSCLLKVLHKDLLICYHRNIKYYQRDKNLHIHKRSQRCVFHERLFYIWGCSSAVERSLCMWKAPGSIPGISTIFLFSLFHLVITFFTSCLIISTPYWVLDRVLIISISFVAQSFLTTLQDSQPLVVIWLLIWKLWFYIVFFKFCIITICI